MRLFLASEIKQPNSMKQLKEFMNGFEGKRVTYIPTASNGKNDYGCWRAGSSFNIVNNTPAIVNPIVLKEYQSKKVIEILRQNDVIWFA